MVFPPNLLPMKIKAIMNNTIFIIKDKKPILKNGKKLLSIIAIPITPPAAILFGAKKNFVAKATISAPNVMKKYSLNFFIKTPYSHIKLSSKKPYYILTYY